MKYMNYELEKIDGGIVVIGIDNFVPAHTFECGQCFRWHREQDGSYTGVVKSKVVNVQCSKDRLKLKGATIWDFISTWYKYFDLDTDYSKVIETLINKDDIMKKAVLFGEGIRLLRQDVWETLVSFIISANNKIPRIMDNVMRLSALYGQKIRTERGTDTYYSFPTSGDISSSCASSVARCGAGFRCKYICDTAVSIQNKLLDLDALKGMDTESARETLMQLPGVGPKVADCVLLFSGLKRDVFPVDIWIKRIMEKLYFGKKTSFAEIRKFARDYFGELSGIAQQYLFYYARENKII